MTTTTTITTTDGVKLAVREVGTGTPVVFVHEFAGDSDSWETQVRFFSRRYRCITFNARGYPPSDVPADPAAYSQQRATEDIRDVLDGLGIPTAHVVGLSMGGFAALHMGLSFPDRALSIVVAGAGYGSEKQFAEQFRQAANDVASQFEALGAEGYAPIYGAAAARIPFLVKDPDGYREFLAAFAKHDVVGSANTMRGVQAERPSVFDLEERMRAMKVPTLIVTGDEDDHCLQPAIFMKRAIPASGLVVLPKTGHAVNLEEPAAFNAHIAEFLAQVEQGRWLPRDPRSNPQEIVKTR